LNVSARVRVVAVALAAIGVVVVAAACQLPPPPPPCVSQCSYGWVTHQTAGDGSGRLVQFVGDSEFYVTTPELHSSFEPDYRVSIDAESGSTTGSILPDAQAAAAVAPDVVVSDLGGNDGRITDSNPTFDPAASEANMEAMVAMFPGACFVWVTGVVDHFPAWDPQNEEVLDAWKEANFPGHTVDWAAAYDPSYYDNPADPHVNATGAAVLASMIRGVVDAACPADTAVTDPPPGSVDDSTTTLPDDTSTTVDDATTTPPDDTVVTDPPATDPPPVVTDPPVTDAPPPSDDTVVTDPPATDPPPSDDVPPL
jgi:hypothetical protein